MINRLPAEILLQILEEAYEEWNPSANSLLVCHRWQILAEPIFRCRFEISKPSFSRRLKCQLEDYPKFRPYVRKLDFYVHSQSGARQAVDIMRLCHNLREFALRSLKRRPYPPHLVGTLRKLPFLQKLELGGFKRPQNDTNCCNTETSILANRQKGKLRNLKLTNIELDSDLVDYLLSLPLTLETLESYHVLCPSCHDQTCRQPLQQRLLDTHQSTLQKIVFMDHYPARQPPRFLDSSLMRLEVLSLDRRKCPVGDLYEVYCKLPAPQQRRPYLKSSAECHQRSPERSFGHVEKIFLEQFMLTLRSVGLNHETTLFHLHYNPDPGFDWSWDHVVDAEILAAKLGFCLTYDQPYYAKQEWKDFRRQRNGELATPDASSCVSDSK